MRSRLILSFFALLITLNALAGLLNIKAPPPGFVDLRSVMPDACFLIPYATADNFTGAPLPGYAAPGAWARTQTAAALIRAHAAAKASGRKIAVFDAYRPMRASQAMTDWAVRVGRTDLIGEYIASSGRSGHNKGHTVDIGLATADCTLLDMGVAFDTFDHTAWTVNAAGQARSNRQRLVSLMEAEGFKNYTKEYWHFSLASEPDAVAIDVPYEYETQ